MQELDIRKEDCSFSDVSKFLEFFNFLSGEFDLLYHGQIKVGEAIIDTRKGYSHDFLESHLPKIEDQISKKSRAMKAKWELIEIKFVPYGKIIDDGLNSLKSIIKELQRNLLKKKKYIIEMKETESCTPYASKISDEKTKTKEYLSRYKRIDFEKELRNHSWKPNPQARKKPKKAAAESSTIQKKQQQYPLL